MIITVEFKKSSIDTYQSFDAVDVTIDYLEESDIFIDLDWNKTKEVYAKYKRWTVHFGLLSESQMDFLNELKVEENPYMRIDATEYGPLIVEKCDAKRTDGIIIVYNQTPVT